jgi:type 1 glutamine amidotransferase
MRPLVLVLAITSVPGFLPAQTTANGKSGTAILVYTRNGKGYVHDNVADSVAAIRKLGAENGWDVDASADPGVFTGANLKRYRALVFSNTNNEAFDTDAQRDAFKRYIEAGGGLAGIHSATGSERNWPYFWSVMGGKFLRHPKLQKFVVRVTDRTHPATRDLPAEFEWTDECYYNDHINPDIQPLLVTDPAKLEDPDKAAYPGGLFGDSMPLAWYHQAGGGREIYVALGHDKQDYANPILVSLIRGSIRWAIGTEK